LMSCRVCLELYSAEEKHSPRTLPCGHSFCDSCLVELNKKKGKRVECPTCRASHPVPASGFPTNYEVLAMLESKQSASSSASNAVPGECVECDEPATLFCHSCGDLCAGCSASVHSNAKSHTVCDIRLKPARFCAEHKDEPVKLYCNGCQKLVCALCAGIGNHKGHDMAEIEKAAETQSAIIDQRLNAILNDANTTRAWMDDIKAEQKRLEEEHNEARLKITRSIVAAMENLRTREDQLETELIRITVEKQKKLELLLSEGSKALSTLDSTHKEGSDLLGLDALSRLEVGGSWIRNARDEKMPELFEFKSPALVTEFEPEALYQSMQQWGRIRDQPADYPFGTRVDACDIENKWYAATVLQETEAQVYVRYEGWSSKWNEWIGKKSTRLATFGTKKYAAMPSQKAPAE